MGNEKRSDTEKEQKSGFPKISAMHVVIAVAVIVLAVIFIAKFGFGTDVISPSSGEMAILKKPLIPAQQVVQTPDVRPTFTFRPQECGRLQTRCGNFCEEIFHDPDNCGACGMVCPEYNSTERKCISGKCSNPCLAGYYDCNQNPADGCESNLGDNDNCGKCGNDCGSGMRCILHQCIEPGGGPERVTQSPLH